MKRSTSQTSVKPWMREWSRDHIRQRGALFVAPAVCFSFVSESHAKTLFTLAWIFSRCEKNTHKGDCGCFKSCYISLNDLTMVLFPIPWCCWVLPQLQFLRNDIFFEDEVVWVPITNCAKKAGSSVRHISLLSVFQTNKGIFYIWKQLLQNSFSLVKSCQRLASRGFLGVQFCVYWMQVLSSSFVRRKCITFQKVDTCGWK